MSEDCVDCVREGVCQWEGCRNDSDWAVREVTVKRLSTHVYVGTVELCGGHMRQLERTGHLNLSWERVYTAIEAEA